MGKIVVIGTGTMAVGIAAGFLNAGMELVVLGRDVGRAQRALDDAAALAATLDGVATGASGSAASARSAIDPVVSGCSTAGHAGLIDDWSDWDGASWVIETVTEDFDVKRAMFASLDGRVPPQVPIGTNSSGYPISRIAAGLATRRRMFNAHYFMPAHLVPLVEIALGEDSDQALGEQVCALYRRAGKKPVLVRKDIPGFLANRIQHALMREALALIDSGIASAEDVDIAVRYSFGFRYAAAGPVLQKEISGWDSMGRAAAEIYPTLSNTQELAHCVAGLVAQGKTGMKAGAGFEEWPPERAQEARAAYEKRLQAAFRILNMP